MTDPYVPALVDFKFAQDENDAVAAALLTEKPWDWSPLDADGKAAIKAAKDRLLSFHLERQKGSCCYCRTVLAGAGPFMTDREHILPKSSAAFRPYCYHVWNLAVACKRCNMQFKGAKNSFVVNAADVTTFQDSSNYRFVHPNFDKWTDHLLRVAFQVNDNAIVYFRRTPGSSKAEFTYQFFDLGGLAVDSFDRAQGAKTVDHFSELARQVRGLAELFGQ